VCAGLTVGRLSRSDWFRLDKRPKPIFKERRDQIMPMMYSVEQPTQSTTVQPGGFPADSRSRSENADAPTFQPTETDQCPFISVIVPVRNEAVFIAGTIEQLVTQDYPGDRFEILVVDGRSTDATWAIAEALALVHPNLQVLDNPKHISSAARNIGLRHARGDLIVVVDGHCELEDPCYLRNLADAFQGSGADCLGRPQPLDVTAASSLQRAIAAARSSALGHHPDSFIYASAEQFVPAKSVAAAYRVSVFNQVGPFDESFDACEDVELNHRIDRAGLSCFFTPKIRIRYFPRSSLKGLFHQLARYGRGRVRLVRKYPETFTPGGFVPAVWLAGLTLGPLASLAWPPVWWVYGGAIALYVAIVLAASTSLALRHRELWFLGLLPLVYVTVHAGFGWGILSELLRPVRPTPSIVPAAESASTPRVLPLPGPAQPGRLGSFVGRIT
jgi:succinoglycan biosynthesis protein ExoA